MRVSEMSNRQLEDELRDIEDRLRSRNLTRREEDELIRDRDTLLDELDYRDRDSRRNQPRENSYGGGSYRNDQPRVERNKDDEVISGYPDENNHCIDSVRYALERVWKKKGQ